MDILGWIRQNHVGCVKAVMADGAKPISIAIYKVFGEKIIRLIIRLPHAKVQGLSQRWSENNGLLLLKYESEGLPNPPGGSTDVVHLLIYVSLVFK